MGDLFVGLGFAILVFAISISLSESFRTFMFEVIR